MRLVKSWGVSDTLMRYLMYFNLPHAVNQRLRQPAKHKLAQSTRDSLTKANFRCCSLQVSQWQVLCRHPMFEGGKCTCPIPHWLRKWMSNLCFFNGKLEPWKHESWKSGSATVRQGAWWLLRKETILSRSAELASSYVCPVVVTRCKLLQVTTEFFFTPGCCNYLHQ